ncbi:MAG: DUF4340 domain-containing protein [Ruminococcus sp.]|nr:DUF4340 domain-containing protein [Ruminococcus sp.]
MNKTAKGIVALAGVLAVLGGGYAALRLTDPDEPEESSVSSEEDGSQHVILIRDDKVTGEDPETGETLMGNVVHVQVKNETDELSVIPNPKAATDENATKYTLEGYEDIPLRGAVIGTLANNANGLTTEAVIEENCSDLAKFGLADPVITVDVTYETGTEKTLLVGNKAPTGDATYVMLKGLDTVYTVRSSAMANYSNTLFDFVDKTIIEDPGQQNYPKVESVLIQREDLEGGDMYIEYDPRSDDEGYTGGTSATHILKRPTEAFLSVERSTAITTGMFGLSAEDIFSVHCQEPDIAEAGLKDPFCTVTMKCDDGNTYKLLLSEPFTSGEGSKSCYAMLEGGNVIYIVSTEKAQWATVTPVDIASKIFIGAYVWNITDLTAQAGDTAAEIKVTRKDPSAELETFSASDFNAAINGKTFDSERFRQFYSFLIGANAEEFALDEEIPEGDPAASITYTDSYSGQTTKVEFYDLSAMKDLIVIDGVSKFTISKSYVETLIENIQKLDSDEEFVLTWK